MIAWLKCFWIGHWASEWYEVIEGGLTDDEVRHCFSCGLGEYK